MSDIFNDFARIAIERGLITEATEGGDETNQRYDSLTNEDICALYNVKPEGMDERHIVEQAHPDPVIIAPSYDKMNGLVENLLERQDIMSWIALKPNDGKHTQERYVKARQDLAMTLLNTAFLLDMKNETELTKFADKCAKRLVKEASPLAVAWMVAKLGMGALALLGLTNNFGGMLDRGANANSRAAIEELTDLLVPGEAPGQQEVVQKLIGDIEYVKSLNEEATSIYIDISAGEAAVTRQLVEAQEAMSDYIVGSRALGKEIDMVLRMFETVKAKPADWAEYAGAIGGLLQSLFEFVWTPNIEEAMQALGTLRGSLEDSVNAIRTHYNALKNRAKQDKQKTVEEIVGESRSDRSVDEPAMEDKPKPTLLETLPQVRPPTTELQTAASKK